MVWMRVSLLCVMAATFRPTALLAQELVTDMSQHLISIESTFNGAELLLFGAVEGSRADKISDIAIVVRGPSDNLIIRRKANVGGLWVNYDAAEIADVPGYYSVVSTRPLEDITKREVLQRHGIGVDNLNLAIEPPKDRDEAPFRQALMRLQDKQNLYRNDANGVVFVGDTLFRATVSMPANVPDGVFTTSVYLFQDGDLIHAQTTPLYVSKAGFERLVYNLAHKQPLLYGILAILVAVFAGWAASAIFRQR